MNRFLKHVSHLICSILGFMDKVKSNDYAKPLGPSKNGSTMQLNDDQIALVQYSLYTNFD